MVVKVPDEPWSTGTKIRVQITGENCTQIDLVFAQRIIFRWLLNNAIDFNSPEQIEGFKRIITEISGLLGKTKEEISLDESRD